jgi:hypothetical protein
MVAHCRLWRRHYLTPRKGSVDLVLSLIHSHFLRSFQILAYQGSLVGTGYHDQLSWATWSPPGRIHHGPPNKAPREAGLAPGGFGVSFSPFYQPTREEILYCVKLSDWWREVQKEEQKHLVYAGPSISHQGFAVKRIHRLISEAGPNVPPDGYFDCTVEVSECNC